MKRLLCFVLATFLTVSMVAQMKSHVNSPNWGKKAPQSMARGDGTLVGQQYPNPSVSSNVAFDDYIAMISVYDLQTNSSVENRLYYYPGDGTLGAIATMAHENNFSDRGTGYNYYDGSGWAPPPAARIETLRTGWPSYAPWGANGEIVVAHQSGTTPLIINTRTTKGTGAWTQTELFPPADANGLLWPRLVTNGPDHMNIHIICMTAPTGNGGNVWNDLDGALVYNRSLDGGVTWDGWQLLDGMTSADFVAFSGDSYCWAEPRGDILCFTSGDNWYDQFIMKSTDNGTTWTKTVVWPCPYTFWAGGDTTETFFCPDGSNTLAIDAAGKVHLAFGMQRANGNEAGEKFWFPFTDGIVYWNEDMPVFPEFMDWDQLYADGNMIGWVTDTNVFYAQASELAYYFSSLTSHPNLIVDDGGDIFCIWDQVTTLRDSYNYMLRHIYGRASFDGGGEWYDFVELTDDLAYNWSECVFPYVAKKSSGDLYFIMQEDDEAGLEFYGSQGFQGQQVITQNRQTVLTRDKALFYPIGIEEETPHGIRLSQNYPNPVVDYTNIRVTTTHGGSLTVEIISTLGRNVWQSATSTILPGEHKITLDASNLPGGVYVYKVTVDGEQVTGKMVVK